MTQSIAILSLFAQKYITILIEMTPKTVTLAGLGRRAVGLIAHSTAV